MDDKMNLALDGKGPVNGMVFNGLTKGLATNPGTFMFAIQEPINSNKEIFDEHIIQLETIFTETINVIESVLTIPVNPFTASVFKNWIDSIDVEKFKDPIANSNLILKPNTINISGVINRRHENITFEISIVLIANSTERILKVYPVSNCFFNLTLDAGATQYG